MLSRPPEQRWGSGTGEGMRILSQGPGLCEVGAVKHSPKISQLRGEAPGRKISNGSSKGRPNEQIRVEEIMGYFYGAGEDGGWSGGTGRDKCGGWAGWNKWLLPLSASLGRWDVDAEREGLPATAGIPRATPEAVGLQRRRKEGWKEGDDSGKKHETDEEWSADVREV